MTQTANTYLPTTDDLCRSVLENNRDSISIQKPELAVRKLALILNAALEISNRKGFQAMSLRDLSQTSGVSMGGLYSYFDSKVTLLKMILSEVTMAVENAPGPVLINVSVSPSAILDNAMLMVTFKTEL